MRNNLTKPFVIFLLILVIVVSYLVFKPFLIHMIIAVVLVSVLYRPFSWLTRRLGGHRVIAALIMCLLVALLVIFPLTELIIYTAQRLIVVSGDVIGLLGQGDFIKDGILEKMGLVGVSGFNVNGYISNFIGQFGSYMITIATEIVKGTANFFLSLFLIVFTMFFFFVGGERIMEQVTSLVPLPKRYDVKLIKKFKAVSRSALVSTFVVIVAQGIVGGVAYWIIGWQALFMGILIAIFSLIPVIGSTVIYIPTAIYLLATGQIWPGVFIFLWGFLVIGTVDNFIRMFMVKDEAQVNPIFVFFSILGGVMLFGFWGIILGPLAVSLAVTVFYIYEQEFAHDLKEVRRS
jgi:predicted PurR-regulated permease PerM